jgi:hypothetical protein
MRQAESDSGLCHGDGHFVMLGLEKAVIASTAYGCARRSIQSDGAGVSRPAKAMF